VDLGLWICGYAASTASTPEIQEFSTLLIFCTLSGEPEFISDFNFTLYRLAQRGGMKCTKRPLHVFKALRTTSGVHVAVYSQGNGDEREPLLSRRYSSDLEYLIIEHGGNLILIF
jgi:hypothetical protein